jgi:hypothetical protein
VTLNNAIIALTAALVVYLSVHLVLERGPESGYAGLEAYRTSLEENVANLETLNQELLATAELFESDVRAIEVAARSLSLYSSSERVIRLPQLQSPGRSLSPGGVLRKHVQDHDHRLVAALAAIVVFLLVLFLLFVTEDQEGVLRHTTRRASR